MTDAALATLNSALEALRARQYAEALRLLAPLTAGPAPLADAWQLAALAHKGLGNQEEAESAFLASLSIAPRQANVLANLGNFYRATKRPEAAISRYRQALALEPGFAAARLGLGRALLDTGDLDGAEQAFRTVVEAHPEHDDAVLGLAGLLQKRGNQEAALGMFQTVSDRTPENAAAHNGMGLALKVLGFIDPAVEALQKALSLRPDSADVCVNLASALAQAGREEEAVAAYERALALAPDNLEIHQWFQGYLGVIAHPRYLDSLRERLEDDPANAGFATTLARKLLLEHRAPEAVQTLERAIAANADVPQLHAELAHVLRESDAFDAALDAARQAHRFAPGDATIQRELATAIMAAGDDYEEAVALLAALLDQDHHNQGLWALYTTALRYAGHTAAYRHLTDYDLLVNPRTIATPPGYPDLDTFVAELRRHLLRLHTTRRHPVEQSMVHGTQTLDDLLSRRDPTVVLLANALEVALNDIVSRLPDDRSHPVLSRNTGAIRFSDSWSVRLLREGFHKNHFHSAGWLSSAFYVAVPELVNRGRGEGWIKFGEPGFRAREPLDAEYWVKPEPGVLVAFPSYLWHGTVPLEDDAERMTVGYDILPR